MTELELLKSQLDDAKASLLAEKNSRVELEKQFKEVTVATSQAKVEDLNKSLKDATDKLNATVAELTQVKTEKSELVSKAEKLEKELTEVKENLAKVAKAQVAATRVATLAKEVNPENAQALYDVVADANLSDEKFNAYVAKMKETYSAYVAPDDKKKAEEEKKKKEAAKKKAAKASEDVENLEKAEEDADADLNLGGDLDSELQEARASIASRYNLSRGRVVEKVKE